MCIARLYKMGRGLLLQNGFEREREYTVVLILDVTSNPYIYIYTRANARETAWVFFKCMKMNGEKRGKSNEIFKTLQYAYLLKIHLLKLFQMKFTMKR